MSTWNEHAHFTRSTGVGGSLHLEAGVEIREAPLHSHHTVPTGKWLLV